MVMQFTRVGGPVEDLEIWSASSGGFSFVITYESRSGPGFHGRTGFLHDSTFDRKSTAAILIEAQRGDNEKAAELAGRLRLASLTGTP
jgi:hypothetical protein